MYMDIKLASLMLWCATAMFFYAENMPYVVANIVIEIIVLYMLRLNDVCNDSRQLAFHI